MVASTSYPLLDAFITTLWIVGFFLWIWCAIAVFADLFRSDMSGWAKAGWIILIILLPLFGVLIYLIARGRKMAERASRDAADQEAAFQSYVRDAAGPSSPADDLAKLADLRDRGVITDAEFEQQKAKVLTGS
jgi:hypothetical protein